MNLGHGKGDGGAVADSMQRHMMDARVNVLQAIHHCCTLGVDGGGGDISSQLEVL